MSYRAKQVVVTVMLGALTLWPLLHIGLSMRFDLSPWKLAGWGMYAAPRSVAVNMNVYGRTGDSGSWEQLRAPSSELAADARAFLDRYQWLRGLTDRGPLIRAIRRARPGWDVVRLEISRSELHRTTGMIVRTRDEYVHADDR